ncbi:MAG: bifunctional folylpolyglutamate synthase/dihydrofolate synthase [Acidimicrobiia bacterium]
MTYEEAVAFLDARIGYGRRPGLDRIRGVLDIMADPHLLYPVVQIAGTNGKTSTTLMTAAVLNALGIRCGSYTSPHLHAPEERFAMDGSTMTSTEFATAVADVKPLVELYEERTGTGITYFELATAVAYAWFAERTAGAAAVEVGLGGRWDATSVVQPEVAVITSIALDHQEYLGGTLAEIAAEKAAIVPSGGVLVSGPLPLEAVRPVAERVEHMSAEWHRMGDSFDVTADRPAVGGHMFDIDGLYGSYRDVYLRMHGAHQAVNFTISVAAAEAVVGRELAPASVAAAAAAVHVPGRLEIVGREPLLVLDGAHNPGGSTVLARALDEELPDLRWSAVVGLTGPRDPAVFLGPLAPLLHRVVAVEPLSSHAVPAAAVAAAAAGFGLESAVGAGGAGEVHRLAAELGDGEGILVTGSLYLVGEVRHAIVGG